MANTFDEQARDRFTKSLKFMQKAEALLEDDLVYRSALADAVSAIKNMLQGYLLLKVANTPASGVTHQWQEAAASNRMPELIAACSEAGLDLRGLAVDIKRLNVERNNRAHDDPLRLIELDQAVQAIETARTLQRRIKAAIQGKIDSRSLPVMAAQAAHVARAAVSGQLNRRAPVASAPAAKLPPSADGATDMPAHKTNGAHQTGASPDAAHAVSLPAEPEGALPSEPGAPTAADALLIEEESTQAGDTDEMLAIEPRKRHRRRGAGVLVRAFIAAALLLVGMVVGAGLMVPVARGQAPEWLAFTASVLPGTPSPTATPVPTATPLPHSTPQTLGDLAVSAAICSTGTTSFTLTNAGQAPLQWAAASPDAPAATFTVSDVRGERHAIVNDLLKPGASVTVSVVNASATGPFAVDVIAPGGAVHVLAGAC